MRNVSPIMFAEQLFFVRAEYVILQNIFKEVSSIMQEKLWTKNFVLIMIINFFVFLNHLMILSTFPFYIEFLHGSEAVAGLAAAAFSLVAVFIRPIIGWILDSGKRGIVLAVGLLGMGAMPLGYMSVSLIVTALLFRVIHGIALACGNTAANTIATDLLPRSRFGEGMGMFGTSIALATASAPALGLFLLNRWGFSVLFCVSAAICFFSLILMGLMKIPVVKVERKPLNIHTLIDADAIPASVITFVFLLTFGALENFLAKFAAQEGLPGGGVFFAIMAVVLLFVRAGLSRLLDRRGEGIFVYTCNISMFIALLLLAFACNSVTYLFAAVFVGYGFGGIAPALQAMAVRLAPQDRRGAANSTYLCAYDLGFGVGGGVAGWLISGIGYHEMFAILTAANVLSVVLYVVWGRKHRSSFRYVSKDTENH